MENAWFILISHLGPFFDLVAVLRFLIDFHSGVVSVGGGFFVVCWRFVGSRKNVSTCCETTNISAHRCHVYSVLCSQQCYPVLTVAIFFPFLISFLPYVALPFPTLVLTSLFSSFSLALKPHLYLPPPYLYASSKQSTLPSLFQVVSQYPSFMPFLSSFSRLHGQPRLKLSAN